MPHSRLKLQSSEIGQEIPWKGISLVATRVETQIGDVLKKKLVVS